MSYIGWFNHLENDRLADLSPMGSLPPHEHLHYMMTAHVLENTITDGAGYRNLMNDLVSALNATIFGDIQVVIDSAVHAFALTNGGHIAIHLYPTTPPLFEFDALYRGPREKESDIYQILRTYMDLNNIRNRLYSRTIMYCIYKQWITPPPDQQYELRPAPVVFKNQKLRRMR